MQAPSPPSPSRTRRGPTSHGPKDVRECEPFVALASRARKRDELDRQLRQTLPSPLREQVRLADLRHGCLVFLAPSPAWASRLRMAQAQILAAARAMGTKADSVIVKVTPPDTVAQPQPPQRAPLSRATAAHLRSAARSLSDPELRDLFLELASVAELSDSPCKTD